MGSVGSEDQSCILLNMKFFVIVSALVAAAYADAGFYGYSALPYVYGKSAPCVNAANQPVACAHGYAAYPYGLVHHLGKRSADAEAEPEADADALLYAGAYSPLTYAAHTYGAYPYSYRHTAYPYAAYNYGADPYTYGAYGRSLGKRSADAEAEPEAEADADALLYAGAYSPLTYGAHAYGAYSYGAYPYAAHYSHAAYPYAAYPYTGYSHGYSLYGK